MDTGNQAALWKRVMARVMDYAILFGLWWVLRDFGFRLIYGYGSVQQAPDWYPLIVTIYALAWVILLPASILWWGRTLGKHALGLHVASAAYPRPQRFRAILAREGLMACTFGLCAGLGVMGGNMWKWLFGLQMWSFLGPALFHTGLAIFFAGVWAAVWERARRRRGQYPHDRLGYTRVLEERNPRMAWLVPVAAAALVSAWWVVWT